MSRFLAIDADAGGLFAAAASVRGAVQIEEVFGSLDEAPASLSAANADALGTRLKALLKEADVAPAPVLLCFGRDRVIIKEVKYPPVAPGEEAAVDRFQALKDLADSGGDVVMDYFPAPAIPGEVQRRATVVFVRKELYAAAERFCESAGLRLAAVTARPFASLAAVRRAIAAGALPAPEDPLAPVAVLSLWGSGGEFAVGAGPHALFSRTVSPMALGGEAALIGEVKRSLAAFNSSFGIKPVAALYLAEGDAAGASRIGRLQAALPIPVHAFDPLAGSKVGGHILPELHGRFLGAVGLLAAKTTGESLGINFQAPRAPRAAPNRRRRSLILGGTLAAVLLLAAGAFLTLQLWQLEKKGVELAAEKADLEERTKLQELENKRVAAAEQFVKREVPWIDIYYDLNDQFPTIEKLRLQEFDGTMIPPPIAKPGQPAQKPVAVPGAKPGAKPAEAAVAKVRLLILGEDATQPEKLKDTLNKEPGYGNAKLSTGGLAGGGASKVQQFTINADLFPKKPDDYVRKITPAKLAAPFEPKPDVPLIDPFDLSGGGQ